MTVRIAIADDSALARAAIAQMLAGASDFDLVGEARDGYEALRLVREQKPEIVLMDLNMPRCDGLVATRLIKRESPDTAVVILTVSDDAADLFEAIRQGAQGYLLKSLAPEDWLTYLRGFSRGDWAVPRKMAERILAELGRGHEDRTSADKGITDREKEVLRLVARAMTNREIAETLSISEQTVKNHLKNILHKLHLKNRVDLAVYARRLNQEGEPEK